jgi:hypothetical protein
MSALESSSRFNSILSHRLVRSPGRARETGLPLRRRIAEAGTLSPARRVPSPPRPIRQRGSSRPHCGRSGRARACMPASVRQAAGSNVAVPRWRSGTLDASAARSSGFRPQQQPGSRLAASVLLNRDAEARLSVPIGMAAAPGSLGTPHRERGDRERPSWGRHHLRRCDGRETALNVCRATGPRWSSPPMAETRTDPPWKRSTLRNVTWALRLRSSSRRPFVSDSITE